MSEYRSDADLQSGHGAMGHAVKSMLRVAEVDAYGDDDVVRVSLAVDEVGEVAQDDADQFGTPGVVGRGASGNASEAVAANLGASPDGIVIIGILDHGKLEILAAESIGREERDFALLYNTAAKLLIRGNEIHAAGVGDSGASLAFKTDAQSVDARITALEDALNALVAVQTANATIFGTHVHSGVTAGMVVSGTAGVTFAPGVASSTSSTIDGTDILKAK